MNHARTTVFGLAVIGVVGLAVGLAQVGGAREAAAATQRPDSSGSAYQVDPVHSNAIFKIKHMNASNFYGRFDSISGSFNLGDAAGFDVTVKADSVDTNNEKRNAHIKSPDVLSAKEFPEIRCVGKDFKKSGDSWKGSGELTLHGVTKPVELTLMHTGSAKGRDGAELAGVETTFTIKRSDFGIKGMIPGVGDEVTLIVALEGGAK
jgi:polyisoprenoid-binding protein YceI